MRYGYPGLFFALILALGIAGCGGGGAPGSTRSQDTQILIQSATVTADSPDFDAALHFCPDGNIETGLFRESGTLDVNAAKIDPNLSVDPFSATIEECTITYLKANEDPASPILEKTTIYPNCPIIEGENSCDVTILDIQRKNFYWNEVANGVNLPAEYPTHYVAQFNCTYQNSFDQRGTIQTEFDFWLADFDKCSQ